MFWTYQNGLCMLIPLGPIQPDGSFDRGVYLYTGPSESHTEPKWTKETGFVKVPEDNGDSWSAGNFLHGALWYIEASAGTNLYEINERFHKVINNQKRAAGETSENAEFQDTGSQESGGSETDQQGTPSAGAPTQPEQPPANLSGKELKQWRRDHGQG
jgi:hypothetical protein